MYTAGNFDSSKTAASQIWKEESEINILVLYGFYSNRLLWEMRKSILENFYLLSETIHLFVWVELFIHRNKFILEMKDVRLEDFF